MLNLKYPNNYIVDYSKLIERQHYKLNSIKFRYKSIFYLQNIYQFIGKNTIVTSRIYYLIYKSINLKYIISAIRNKTIINAPNIIIIIID